MQRCEKDCKQPVYGVRYVRFLGQVSLVKFVLGIETAILSTVSALSWSWYSCRREMMKMEI
jgi:hypothetical protein